MRKFFVFSTFIVLQYLNESLLALDSYAEQVQPECITLIQLIQTIQILCENQRNNQTLWNTVIECHRPITDEFMRSSANALCPNPKYVQDPTDTRCSMADVFFNICGVVQGSAEQIAEATACIKLRRYGDGCNGGEVKEVKRRWGNNLLCKIGQCIKKVALVLGV